MTSPYERPDERGRYEPYADGPPPGPQGYPGYGAGPPPGRYPPQQYGSGRPPGGGDPWKWVAVVLAAVVAIGALAAVIGLWLVPALRDDTTAASGTTAAPPASAPAVAPPPAAPVPAAPGLPAGASTCSSSSAALGSSAVGSSVTSCEFAEAVRAAYASQPVRGQSVTVSATSPVTGTTYPMACSGSTLVRCTGGDNAVVYVY
ncbi:serine/threonine protein kinase [Rhodococcus rhodnii]|nr:serine/threonine protein kinase [Rhodococcus rhodnii]